MRFGLAPVQSESTFEAMFTQAALAESLGFDVLWAHEHHSQAMMYPSPLMTLAALASRTSRIALGTNMLLLPLHHPLQVAEEAAMVDVLSQGRLVLGVALGYASDEFAAFGVDLAERSHRMSQGLRLIRRAWTEDSLAAEGTDFRLEGFSLFPRPMQQPSPPIYVGAGAPAGIRRAARLGDGLVLSATATLTDVQEAAARYREALIDSGVGPDPEALAINRVTHVVENNAEKDAAERWFSEHFLHFYDRWGHPSVTKLGDAERVHQETSRQHFILGEPSECIERLHEYAEMGATEIACLMNFGKPELPIVERSMRLFAERVAPFAPDAGRAPALHRSSQRRQRL